MRVHVTTAWVPRAGSNEAQYEDAFYPGHDGPRHARRLRFAVADGASESMLSGLWAGLLVRTWCKARRRRLPEILDVAEAAWDVELAAYLEERGRTDRPIQWFEEPGLERGAYATLLGLAFTTEHGGGRWQATAVGDSCLFQVREGELLSAFPIKSSDEFDSAPKLVPSRASDRGRGRLLDAVDEETGDWRSGDTFWLLTDAVAAWFLRTHEAEADAEPWDVLASVEADAFADWVESRRADRSLRNDDVTVMRIDVA